MALAAQLERTSRRRDASELQLAAPLKKVGVRGARDARNTHKKSSGGPVRVAETLASDV
jgi:hypothetical protein